MKYEIKAGDTLTNPDGTVHRCIKDYEGHIRSCDFTPPLGSPGEIIPKWVLDQLVEKKAISQ